MHKYRRKTIDGRKLLGKHFQSKKNDFCQLKNEKKIKSFYQEISHIKKKYHKIKKNAFKNKLVKKKLNDKQRKNLNKKYFNNYTNNINENALDIPLDLSINKNKNYFKNDTNLQIQNKTLDTLKQINLLDIINNLIVKNFKKPEFNKNEFLNTKNIIIEQKPQESIFSTHKIETDKHEIEFELLQKLNEHEFSAYKFFRLNLQKFYLIDPSIVFDSKTSILNFDYSNMRLDTESVFNLKDQMANLSKYFNFERFLAPFLIPDFYNSNFYEIGIQTNLCLSSGIHKFDSFLRLCLELQFNELEFNVDCLNILKTTFLQIMSFERSTVRFLFPQNEYLEKYINCITKKIIFKHEHELIRYLYFLHLFDVLLEFDYKKLYEKINDKNKDFLEAETYNRRNLLQNYGCKLENSHRKRSFFCVLKTELQRIYCLLINPFLTEIDFKSHIYIFMFENFSYYKFCGSNSISIANCYKKYPENSLTLILRRIFFAIKIFENEFINNKICFSAAKETLFDADTFFYFRNMSTFLCKIKCFLRIQKIYFIFLFYFKNKNLEFEDQVIIENINHLKNQFDYIEKNHSNIFSCYFDMSSMASPELISMLNRSIEIGLDILTLMQKQSFKI
ncbi:hypothetical protein GVAV_003555 [Gurleya vavrai]